MDPDNQATIQRLAAENDASEVVVLLGAADPEAIEVAAETVTVGDPSYVGPLAGVSLGLPVFHILEEEMKAQVDPAVWEEQLGLLEMALDVDEVRRVMAEVRART
jgi:glycine/sarcosine/betaine reductase complex component A